MLSLEDTKILAEAYSFQVNLQQALRIAVSGKFDVENASKGLQKWLAQTVGESNFFDVNQKLKMYQQKASEIRTKKIGSLATEN